MRLKTRIDAKLKILPEDRRLQIYGYLRSHSLDKTRSWLREKGITTSNRALSEFYAWFPSRHAAGNRRGGCLLELIRRQVAGLNAEQLENIEACVSLWIEDMQNQADCARDMLLPSISAKVGAGLDRRTVEFREEIVSLLGRALGDLVELLYDPSPRRTHLPILTRVGEITSGSS